MMMDSCVGAFTKLWFAGSVDLVWRLEHNNACSQSRLPVPVGFQKVLFHDPCLSAGQPYQVMVAAIGAVCYHFQPCRPEPNLIAVCGEYVFSDVDSQQMCAVGHSHLFQLPSGEIACPYQHTHSCRLHLRAVFAPFGSIAIFSGCQLPVSVLWRGDLPRIQVAATAVIRFLSLDPLIDLSAFWQKRDAFYCLAFVPVVAFRNVVVEVMMTVLCIGFFHKVLPAGILAWQPRAGSGCYHGRAMMSSIQLLLTIAFRYPCFDAAAICKQ
ncbi:hypothetical protein Tco_0859931 [Tanacetum coccineum]|uniref:Uncharacterized protein n=1 Tax=Tanacetum coccineum TaxID=301880 RepID=A0ABQ5BF87_9ASTR